MAAAVPVVRVLGPGRNVGKTWLSSRLIETLVGRGFRVAAIKSSHHPMPEDRPRSDTALFAAAGARPVVFAAGDGTLTRGPARRDLATLVGELPPAVDVAVVEGFRTDSLGARIEIVPGTPHSYARLRAMDGTLAYEGAMDDVPAIADALRCVLGISAAGGDAVRSDIRRAAQAHGHRCPGLTLGVRMARYAIGMLGGSMEACAGELLVEAETARCATDAIAAVTGCTTGSGRLHVVEYGKLAATFSLGGDAVRVSARPGLRDRARLYATCEHDVHAQDEAYRTLPDADLFEVRPATALPPASQRRGGRGLCAGCGEEVAGALLRETDHGPRCIPCSRSATRTGEIRPERQTLSV